MNVAQSLGQPMLPCIACIMVILAAIMPAGRFTLAAAQTSQAPGTGVGPSAAAGSEAWRVIESVLVHPRCINCHTVSDYPRQGNDRHRHQLRVVRGPDDRGVPGARCAACHQEDNQAASGVPGAPNWRLAPRSMAFESAPGVAMRGGNLCRRLLDRTRNGNLGLRGLELHFTRESLVQWAWSPGTLKDGSQRTPPSVSQEEFAAALRAWSAVGAPCPKGG